MTYCVFACLQTKFSAALFAELLLFLSDYKYTYMYNMNSCNSSNNAMVPVLPRSRRDMTGYHPTHKKYGDTHVLTHADIHNILTHTTHTQKMGGD